LTSARAPRNARWQPYPRQRRGAPGPSKSMRTARGPISGCGIPRRSERRLPCFAANNWRRAWRGCEGRLDNSGALQGTVLTRCASKYARRPRTKHPQPPLTVPIGARIDDGSSPSTRLPYTRQKRMKLLYAFQAHREGTDEYRRQAQFAVAFVLGLRGVRCVVVPGDLKGDPPALWAELPACGDLNGRVRWLTRCLR